jgi:beta-lactamase class A
MVFKSEQQILPGVKPAKKKLEKKGKRSDGRKAIVVLFMITVLASALFYLQTEAPRIWEKITSPRIISKLPEGRFNPQPTIKKIRELTRDLTGTYGVYVYRLEDGSGYGFNQEKNFPLASLNKLPVMIAAYQQAEEGKIDLETEYELQEKDKLKGAGVLQEKPAGAIYTYRELIEFMAQYSDNSAFKVMRQVTGEEIIEEMTPEAVGQLFKELYQEKIISNEYRDELLEFLTETNFEDRIPQGVPEDIRVAHKIGTETGVFADAGIVFADAPFVLVIMSKNVKESEALEILPKITQAVWELETLSP